MLWPLMLFNGCIRSLYHTTACMPMAILLAISGGLCSQYLAISQAMIPSNELLADIADIKIMWLLVEALEDVSKVCCAVR